MADRVKVVPDPKIQKIVDGWPFNFASKRARDMGYAADASFDEIIQPISRRARRQDRRQGCIGRV
ncbi:MAG: hypothetical protein R3C69_10560 [Geminicoccaceae bacterium]